MSRSFANYCHFLLSPKVQSGKQIYIPNKFSGAYINTATIRLIVERMDIGLAPSIGHTGNFDRALKRMYYYRHLS